jgi:lysine 2,3-aminomutase
MTNLRTPAQLLDRGLISEERKPALDKVAARYAIALPEALAQLVDATDPNDPIARQFVPDAAELELQQEEAADPIGDAAHSPVEGIVHRYPDRVLLKVTHICAVYCRFCFRREMIGPGKPVALTPRALTDALDYIRSHPEIWEVILTGGDPLVLSSRRLRTVMKALSNIDHVKVVRVHTRIPIADPERITPGLVRALRIKGKPTYVAVHVNHPRELSKPARAACARLVDAGIPLVSQTVLLRGVNDKPDVMSELMRALVECRIKPYYLHHGDLAPGTAHLRTGVASGQELVRSMRGQISGLCQPTYVLDIPGGYGKSPIGPNYIQRTNSDTVVVEDFRGRRHIYSVASDGCR